jgi:hypothetical protein
MPEKRSGFAKGCAAVLGCAGLLVFGAATLVCVGGFVGGRLFNAGPVSLGPVDESWTVEGRPDLVATEIAAAITTHCHPMGNGLDVWFQHLWYNAMTSNYDRRLWMEGPGYNSYGLYFWSDHLFLRDEAGIDGYRNRVLTCDAPVVPER